MEKKRFRWGCKPKEGNTSSSGVMKRQIPNKGRAARKGLVQLFESSGRMILVLIPAAYLAGFVAWQGGVRTMGLPFLPANPVHVLALGAVAVAWAGVLALAYYLGRKPSTKVGKYALAGTLGGSFTLALGHVLVGTLGWVPQSAWHLWVAGGVIPPAAMLYVDRTFRPTAEASSLEALFVGAGLLLVLAGIVGLWVVPELPASAGGLAPVPAVFIIDQGYPLPGELQSGAGNGTLVWVLHRYGDDWVVRPGCDDPRGAAAFLIPAQDVQFVRWLDRGTHSRACSS